MRSSTSPVGSFGLMVSAVRGTTLPVTVTTLSGRAAFDLLEERARGIDHALGDAVVVAQVDEQQVAVVALAVDPAGEADRLAGVGEAQRAAGMGAIGDAWDRSSTTGRPH